MKKKRPPEYYMLTIGLTVLVVCIFWNGMNRAAIEKHMRQPLTQGETLIDREDALDWAAKVGDSFGGFNALLSSLAFLGVLYSLALQRKQINEALVTAEQAKRQADTDQMLQARIADAGLETARLNAITARVAGYNEQMRERRQIATDTRKILEERSELPVANRDRLQELERDLSSQIAALEDKRNNLLTYLDAALQRAGIDEKKAIR